MDGLKPDHVLLGRSDADLQRGAVQVGTETLVAQGEDEKLGLVGGQPVVPDLFGVTGSDTGFHDPLTNVEFHGGSSLFAVL